MVILYKFPTGNSGQMLYLYYSHLIMNFIEVTIRKKEWIACSTLTCSLFEVWGGERNGISTGLNEEWMSKMLLYSHRGHFRPHRTITEDFFIQLSNGNTVNYWHILGILSIYKVFKNLLCTVQQPFIKPSNYSVVVYEPEVKTFNSSSPARLHVKLSMDKTHTK